MANILDISFLNFFAIIKHSKVKFKKLFLSQSGEAI